MSKQSLWDSGLAAETNPHHDPHVEKGGNESGILSVLLRMCLCVVKSSAMATALCGVESRWVALKSNSKLYVCMLPFILWFLFKTLKSNLTAHHNALLVTKHFGQKFHSFIKRFAEVVCLNLGKCCCIQQEFVQTFLNSRMTPSSWTYLLKLGKMWSPFFFKTKSKLLFFSVLLMWRPVSDSEVVFKST